MAKALEKRKALLLRQKGMSIKDIAEKLKVSKGSMSLWCQDIVLTDIQKKRLKINQIKAGHKGRMIGAEMNHQRRLKSIEAYKVRGGIRNSNFVE